MTIKIVPYDLYLFELTKGDRTKTAKFTKREENRIHQARHRLTGRDSDERIAFRDVKEIFGLQDGRCCYCGIPFQPFYDYWLDHIIPVIKGGTNHPDNIALTCAFCNRAKHFDTMDEWRQRRGW